MRTLWFAAALGVAQLSVSPGQGSAATITACTSINLCYCINADNQEAINANIARVRQLIIDQRTQGKAIGYISVPLSTTGGSYFGVNQDIAKEIKDRIEKRFGRNSVWMLNPGAEVSLPAGASGPDSMLRRTQILEGATGPARDSSST